MKMNRLHIIILLILGLLAFTNCKKDEPSADQRDQFYKLFGGSYTNEAINLIEDDGNYLLLGNTTNETQSGIVLIKTDDFGNTVWSKYIISDTSLSAGQVIKLKSGAGYAVVGTIETNLNNQFTNIYLLIFNNNGEIQQELTYDYSKTYDRGTCIVERQEGGFIIGGSTADSTASSVTKQFWFTVNSQFEIEHTLVRGTTNGSETLTALKADETNGLYLATGTPYSNSNSLIVLSNTGQPLVSLDYAFNGVFNNLVIAEPGLVYVCGSVTPSNNQDIILASVSYTAGSTTLNWVKEFGPNPVDIAKGITINDNNNLLISGYTQNNQGVSNMYIVELDKDGNLLSNKEIGGDDNDYGATIIGSGTQGFLITGTTFYGKTSMISLIKTTFDVQ